ncbi:MAG: hypothetical protein FWC50_09145, partial [Planctomycetaceae bacterium]|nr:hypothetical protein [Planctomycetaceae bacterium]
MTYLKYLIPRLLILAVLAGVCWFSLNTVIRRALIQSWHEKTGMELEIGTVKTMLDPTQIEFENVRVIFPRQNDNPSDPATSDQTDGTGKAAATVPATIDKMNVQFDRGELLRRRFYADETRLHNLKLDFSSLGDGNQLDLSPYWRQAQAQFAILAANANKIPIDELMSKNLDEAAKKIAEQTEAYQYTARLAKKWDSEINSIKLRSETIGTQLQTLKQQVDSAGKSPDKLAMVVGVLQQIDSLDKEIINLQNIAPQIEQTLKSDKEGLIQAIKNDQSKLQALSKPKIDPKSFSEYVLGDEMREKLSGLIAWVDWGRSQIPQDDANWLEPLRFFSVKRMAGTTVTLPGTESKAEVLFGNIGIDGQMTVFDQPVYFGGGIRNYTNQPKKLAKPLVLRFCVSKDVLAETLPDEYLKMLAEQEPNVLFRADQMQLARQPVQNAGLRQQTNPALLGSFGQKVNNVDFFQLPQMSGKNADNQTFLLEIPTLYVTAMLDRTGNVPHDRFLIVCPEYYLPQRTLGNAGQLAFAVSPGTSQFRAELEFHGDTINGNLALLQSPVTIQPSLPPNMRGTPIERSLGTLASGIDNIQAEITISGTRTNPSYTFSSNIGDKLTVNIEPLLQQEWDQVNQKMVSLVNQKITASSNQLDGGIIQQLQPLFNKIGENRQLVGSAFQQNGIDPNQLVQSQLSRLSDKDREQVQKILANPITQSLLNGKLPGTQGPANALGQSLQ